MADLMEGKGKCLCGAVSFTTSQLAKQLGACHCSMCRKWGGGPLLAVDCGADVRFKGEENIAMFNSSDWAERGFCKHCGTHLFYRLKHSQQYFMPVGLLEDEGQFEFDHQVFIDEKPAYYCFSNRTEDMTGAEVFAKYAPPSD